MPAPSHRLQPPFLSYGTSLGVGAVRVHAPTETELYIEIGPQPAGRRLLDLAPVALLALFLSVAFGLLLFGVMFRPAAIPYAGLLLVPTVIGLVFCGMELWVALRGWRMPSRLSVLDGVFSFPYPSPRSQPEEIPVSRINRIDVVCVRSRILRLPTRALEIGITGASTFRLYKGYPQKTLDEVTNLLGPAMGLVVA
jgi:hypothetical protein